MGAPISPARAMSRVRPGASIVSSGGQTEVEATVNDMARRRWLAGAVRGRRDLAASGGWLVGAGLAGFAVLAVFFEVVVGLGGRWDGAASRHGLAAMLILAGLVLLGRRLLAAGRS